MGLQRIFDGAGAMAPLLHDCDWASTSFGPKEQWPQSLRSAASICLGAKYPMAIYWGHDLSLIYNEAWSAIPGDKHPWALGRPAAEVWPEIWHIVGPQFERAMAGEGTFERDRLLPMRRRGYLEETYFNYNLSPIVAEDGVIAGVFNAGIETTERVVSERRQQILLDLAAAGARCESVADVCGAVVATLSEHRLDVPMAQLHLFEDGAAMLRSSTAEVRPSVPSSVVLDEDGPDPWGLRGVATTKAPVVIDDVDRLVRIDPVDDWPDAPSTAVVIPVLRGLRVGLPSVGALVVGVPAGLEIDDAMRRFHRALGNSIATSLVEARRDEEGRRRFEAERQIAATLQQSLIPALPDISGVEIEGRYLPGADGVEVGGDWYDALELAEDCIGLVIGDVVGKGVVAAAQMGQLSNAVRAYMLEGFSPREVLERLNRLTRSVAGSTFATVLCLDFNPSTRELRWARAGHLPPMIRAADGTVRRLDDAGSAPVGVFDDERSVEWSTTMDDGDTLVLYTDGLIERRDEDIDAGMDRLAVALEMAPADESFIDSVLAAVMRDEWRDDVAILVLRV